MNGLKHDDLVYSGLYARVDAARRRAETTNCYRKVAASAKECDALVKLGTNADYAPVHLLKQGIAGWGLVMKASDFASE